MRALGHRPHQQVGEKGHHQQGRHGVHSGVVEARVGMGRKGFASDADPQIAIFLLSF